MKSANFFSYPGGVAHRFLPAGAPWTGTTLRISLLVQNHKRPKVYHNHRARSNPPVQFMIRFAHSYPSPATAVTNALSAPASRAAGPALPLSTAPVPLRCKRARHERLISHWPQERRASVCGSAARVALRLHFPARTPTADRRRRHPLHLNNSTPFCQKNGVDCAPARMSIHCGVL